MGWRQEFSKPLNDASEVITAPLLRILGPVEAGIGGTYEIDDEPLPDPMLAKAIKGALSSLSPREERIVRLRTETAFTYAAIGDMFNLSTERIRQIEAKALRKLRHPSRGLSKLAKAERMAAPTTVEMRVNASHDAIPRRWNPHPLNRPSAPQAPIIRFAERHCYPPKPEQFKFVMINGPQRVAVTQWADKLPDGVHVKGEGPFAKFVFNDQEWWGPSSAFHDRIAA